MSSFACEQIAAWFSYVKGRKICVIHHLLDWHNVVSDAMEVCRCSKLYSGGICKCRSSADAELQAAIARHAADCKHELDLSNTVVEAILSRVLGEGAMQLEEADVHDVRETSIR